MNLRFENYEAFLKGLADLAGNIRQANIKNKLSRQMSMASHIVDVLNNKINSTNTILPRSSETPSKTAKSNVVTANLKSANKEDSSKQEIGFAETAVDGNLALAVDNNDITEETLDNSLKQSPQLKLIKNTKTVKTKVKASNEWADERSILKSPVVIIGFALIIMVLLILFW